MPVIDGTAEIAEDPVAEDVDVDDERSTGIAPLNETLRSTIYGGVVVGGAK